MINCHSEERSDDAYHTMKWYDAATTSGCEATGRILKEQIDKKN